MQAYERLEAVGNQTRFSRNRSKARKGMQAKEEKRGKV
jgi:hypothetical protein